MQYGTLWWLVGHLILPRNVLPVSKTVPRKGSNHDKEGTWRGHLADKEDSQMSPSFTRELRRALYGLYDWVSLSKSPLTQLIGVKDQEDSPSALRATLKAAIDALKPADDVSPRARAWRTYQVLHARYVEQFTQGEVAGELGLSIRHLRREEGLAVQSLAAYLWDHYGLETKWQDHTSAPPPPDIKAAAGAKTPTQEQELGWLQDSLPSERANVEDMIQTVLHLTDSLAQESRVQVDCRIPEGLPCWIVKATPLQQALLITFTIAIGLVPGGQISVVAAVDGKVHVDIVAKGPAPVREMSENDVKRLGMARQLVGLSAGTLEIPETGEERETYTIKIAVPAEEQIPVLVVDDNADTLRLLQRYLSNSRYCFNGTSDPQRALQLAEELAPKAILLDVMLPDIDGWELLGCLNEYPKTGDIPIIVCTILPQEQLALSLGAAAFIPKPVSRPELLATLDRLLGRPPPESC
jgi:CheY-like chemotaxis protein